MKKRHRQLWILPLLLLVAFSCSFVAHAAEQTGSITVTLHNGNVPRANTAVTVWHVADSAPQGYVTLPDYAAAHVALNGLLHAQAQADAAKQLAAFCVQKQLAGTCRITDAAGTALFSDLAAGLYLLHTENAATDPFFVSVPLCNPDGSGLIYHVNARPKSSGHSNENPALPDKKLPQTGQNLLGIWFFSIAGLLTAGVGGTRLYRDRQAHTHEKK